MKVEIWSDFTCPFCYIGKVNFEQALKQFTYKDCVTVQYYSFQLDQELPFHEATTMKEAMLHKYEQKTSGCHEDVIVQIEEEASRVGLSLKLEKMYYTLTNDVHRLTKLAKKEGKEKEFVDLVFERYFNDCYHIGEKETLKQLARELQLDIEHVEETLSMNCFNRSVKEDIELAEDLGIDSVPFFIINEQYALVGAQPVSTFLETLYEVWEQEGHRPSSLENVGTKTHSFCTGDDCELS
ncbi:MAG TPA: DsbA family oxidoreductase [Pseudogracilibacillus sp.]|nr:DsbA family oxidoreductase [Pseudogracilibacillus sp.]